MDTTGHKISLDIDSGSTINTIIIISNEWYPEQKNRCTEIIQPQAHQIRDAEYVSRSEAARRNSNVLYWYISPCAYLWSHTCSYMYIHVVHRQYSLLRRKGWSCGKSLTKYNELVHVTTCRVPIQKYMYVVGEINTKGKRFQGRTEQPQYSCILPPEYTSKALRLVGVIRCHPILAGIFICDYEYLSLWI